LSALPDCLLHVIMSSLNARQVVQTCVLATRWRHLWRSVPCLDIDLDEFGAAAPVSEGHSDSDLDSSDSDRDISNSDDNKGKEKERGDFEDFTQNLMHRCNIALLDSFSLNVCRKGHLCLTVDKGSTVGRLCLPIDKHKRMAPPRDETLHP
ncbi:hypothetical protein BAE44_0022195, partial [Dichanthelium oligosanthes]